MTKATPLLATSADTLFVTLYVGKEQIVAQAAKACDELSRLGGNPIHPSALGQPLRLAQHVGWALSSLTREEALTLVDAEGLETCAALTAALFDTYKVLALAQIDAFESSNEDASELHLLARKSLSAAKSMAMGLSALEEENR